MTDIARAALLARLASTRTKVDWLAPAAVQVADDRLGSASRPANHQEGR